ncbi:MAG: RNA polymerase factor sigma-54 [Bacteroidales bacterium]|nr:RNA polymerase factor sigma-54 [Bacteroidales bacterium]MBN2757784.1 RNA polymerase factor sigma-54 [Bacteroidales bacterium]
MLNQRLQQKLIQKLSPQQIQLIKLLEVPAIQLEQRIKKEIEENPVLEEGREEDDMYEEQNDNDDDEYDSSQDEFTLEDYIQDDETPNYKLSANNYSADDRKVDIPYSTGTSFHEHLKQQLGLRILSSEKQILADYLIGNIDEDGYLRRDVEAIANDIAFSQNIITDEKELLDILEIIHDFDPPGVGARDLQESLALQLKHKIKILNGEENLYLKLANKIISNFFIEFTKKHYDKIIQKLNLSDEDLKNAIEIILKLNPKPGSAYSNPLNRNSQHITPDFLLENIDGELILSLNSKNIPELKVSRTYANMLESYHSQKDKHSKHEKEAISFVKQKLDSAKWFIDAIKQRQNTLMHTMEAIVQYQNAYFSDGDETKLRPMILKDIAEKTNLDISTISRVVNSKYVQTHFGIFALKYFFSEGMQTDTGEEVSTREIKKILQECIGSESNKKPLTDEKLAEVLQEKGYQIARRTVAKYREQLNIPVARMRKTL